MPAELSPRFKGWRQDSHMQFQLTDGHVTIVVIPALAYEEFEPDTLIAIDNAIKTCIGSITTAIRREEE